MPEVIAPAIPAAAGILPRLPDGIQVVFFVPGVYTLEVTPNVSAINWTTAAVGGFGSCEVDLQGDIRRYVNQIGYLSFLRVHYGDVVLFEGRVEDHNITWVGTSGQLVFKATAYGLQRLLTETSVRRIWLDRSMNWQTGADVSGSTACGAGTTFLYDPQNWGSVTVGQFDPTDLTRIGVEIKGITQTGATSAGSANGVLWYSGGATLKQILFTFNNQSGKDVGSMAVQASTDGSTWTDVVTSCGSLIGPAAFSGAIPANATWLRLVAYSAVNHTGGLHTLCQWENMRVLGVFTSEDATGGYYGGTILNDLIGLIPNLNIGNIESGSDFLIEEIHRAVRSAALDVVNEVASYYTREWAVWDSPIPGSGNFYWQTVDFNTPQWVIPIEEMSDLELDGSLDGIARTVYVTYTDAATQFQSEQSASASGSAVNPYLTTSQTKDYVLNAPVQMTDSSASQLAQVAAQQNGSYVPVGGRCVVPLDALLDTPFGRQPAFTLRAGQNILIPNLPKTDLFNRGRDGETLFHVTGTQVDLAQGTLEIELEGLVTELDVMLARVAEAARFPSSPGSPQSPSPGRGWHGGPIFFGGGGRMVG